MAVVRLKAWPKSSSAPDPPPDDDPKVKPADKRRRFPKKSTKEAGH